MQFELEFRVTKISDAMALRHQKSVCSLVLTRHLDLLLLFHLFLVSLHTAQMFHKFDNFDNSVLSHMFHFVYDFLLTDFDDEKLRPKYFFLIFASL